jgi:hypothetical protein
MSTLINIYHIYVIALMAFSLLLCGLAASGMFDIWGSRYLKRKHRDVYTDNQIL